ncbi:cardiolipin synthetase, putative [Theileria equi strain WA]|uniref:Cardiolipin synthetase, putative n=1 Tax=Theileria equi strain WA TaxID=1537102 RepID=L0B1W3_THEEQ|nr:cardiolipin synthetase, putative [Theileria equi strain WA]AFZ81236.1 cardiolipin synthetase, putative [Theileria equi strain WA]|eukprot:XP_004830902.1 cardiolipin synthetase, putative [Theileria equi strain WA]
MLKQINNAKERIWMEVYIFDDSPLAQIFCKALKNAAERGCNVILLIDYIGSLHFPNSLKQELENSGVNVQVFNPLSLTNALGPITFRNHKKILVVDDNTAYCGSLNISKRVVDEELGGDGAFYDIHARVHGPVVYDLAESFLSSLRMTNYTGPIDGFERPKEIDGGVLVQVLESNTSGHKKDIQSSLLLAIAQANNNIYLSTSYFIPPGSLRRALLSAKARNLMFHMLLSGNSDVFGDRNATFYVLRKFFRRKFARPVNNNFKVFMTNYHHYHGKVLVVDDLWSSIGSFNWDRLSSRRNMEVTLGIFDPKVASKLKRLQMEKEKESTEYTRNDSINRMKILKLYDFVAYHIAKISGFKQLLNSYFPGGNLLDGLSNEGFKVLFKKTFIRTFVDQNVGDMVLLSNLPGV